MLNLAIENNTDVTMLHHAEIDIRTMNNELAKSPHTSSHNLLYLTQKVIEFVQRKQEFIDRYGSSQTAPQAHNQNNTTVFLKRHKDGLSKIDLNKFEKNLDAISIASSNLRKRNTTDAVSILNKIQHDISSVNPVFF